MKDIRNLLRLEKETEAIKDIILRDVKNLFDHEEESYYRPVKVFGVTIILKIYLQQKKANIFHQVFQFLQYLCLEA